MVRSNPAARMMRPVVSSVGDFRPWSYADRVVRDVPALAASVLASRPADGRRHAAAVVTRPDEGPPDSAGVQARDLAGHMSVRLCRIAVAWPEQTVASG